MKKSIESLLNNKEFCKKLLALSNAEEISKLVKEQGFDISKDELSKIETYYKKFKDNKLSDEELDKVAGGTVPFNGSLKEEENIFPEEFELPLKKPRTNNELK